MLTALVFILIILWFFGYVRLDGLVIPDFELFGINGHPVTLWSILILLITSWAIGVLPTPLREIVGVLLILWILAVLGILSLTGIPLSSLIIIAIIVGLIVAIFTAANNRTTDAV